LSSSLFELENIVPAAPLVFQALQKDPKDIRVVIIGHDPYPSKSQACGLSFATLDGKVPASLRNVFKEVQRDCGGELRTNGDLSDWIEQGVLLLNICLTTESGHARAHSNVGWQVITAEIMNIVCLESPHCVFLLWGQDAMQAYGALRGTSIQGTIDILTSCHPAPMAYNAESVFSFKNCGHFKRCNDFLTRNGCSPIKWN